MELRDRWNRLLPDAQPLGADLLARYAEPHRGYHDLRHLTEMLDAIDELAPYAADPDAVRLAAWFHDAVYEPRARDNEEQSALLAEVELAAYGLEPDRVAEIGRLVRLTATHRAAADDRNGAVLCDADLRILAAEPDRYAEYTADVRREYSHLAELDFARGRTEVLQRLAERDRLYRTDAAHERWEQPARDNLRRELAELLPQTVRPAAGLVPLIYLGLAAGVLVGASVLLGRGVGAAASWPARPDDANGFPAWLPIAGTALAAGLTCAWVRRVRPLLLGAGAAAIVVAGAAGIAVSWWRWPQARPGLALSERWPYLLLGSISVLIAGGLLVLALRLRATPMYGVEPRRRLGLATVVAGAMLAGIAVVAAGPPFAQARLEAANTFSTPATSAPGTLPVQLDGDVAWSRSEPAEGTIAGTAGGLAEIRPDGVAMLDPATGETRWRYARADVDDANSPEAHSLIVSVDRRTLAVNLPYGGPGARGDLDLPSYAVIDTISGQVLAEVRTDGVALAVDADRLITAEGNYVTQHGVSRPTHWRYRTRCEVVRGELVADQVVVVDACAGQGTVVRGLSLDGKQRWESDLGAEVTADAESDPATWVGDLTPVPDTRWVSGLIWTAAAGGTLQWWTVDTGGDGKVMWTAPVPGTPRPRLGPNACPAQVAATRGSLVVVACRGSAGPGEPGTYDVAAVNPADGVSQWHQLLTVAPQLRYPGLARDGFALLPDGRVVTLWPLRGGGCAPLMIGPAGLRARPLAAGWATGPPGACSQPRVTVVAGRPVVSDGHRLTALR